MNTKHKTISFFIFISTLICGLYFFNTIKNKNLDSDSIFKFHLVREPSDINPYHSSGTSGNYLLFNLFRSLYTINTNAQPDYELASKCTWHSPTDFRCKLSKNHLWSDGSKITADQWIKGFHKLISIGKASQLELLSSVEGLMEAWENHELTPQVKILKLSEFEIQFILKKPDPEFEFKLNSPAFTPLHPKNIFLNHNVKNQNDFNPENIITNGPYSILNWNTPHSIILKPNSYYPGHKNRPLVKIFFIDEDSSALTLYENKKLNFLRRVPTTYVEKLKNRSDFFEYPMSRFDYIGLNNIFFKDIKVRKLIATHLNFNELQKMYFSNTPPGCPGFALSLREKPSCFEFAKKQNSNLIHDKIKLSFSLAGGDDIKKGMEWVQNQLKKNLSLEVELNSMEQGVFLNELKKNNLMFFRKGIPLSRPTCLAALENFSSTHPENFVNFKNNQFDNLLIELQNSKNLKIKKQICQSALNILMNSYSIIPLGEIHFTILNDQKFTGWTLNTLNYFNLSQLHKTEI